MKIITSRPVLFILIALLLGGCSWKHNKTTAQNRPTESTLTRLESSYYYYLEAQLRIRSGKNNEAIDYMHQALSMDPESIFMRTELASLYLKQKQTEKALELLNGSVEIDPDHVETLLLMGNINHSMKQNEKAKTAASSGTIAH